MIFLLLFKGVLLDSKYYGQEIRSHLFKTETGGFKYDPNVIPIAYGIPAVYENNLVDDRSDFKENESVQKRTTNPVIVQTEVEIEAMDDIDISGQFMDATIDLIMTWNDPRLKWDPADFGGVTSIRALQDEVWIPELNVVNRINDFSYQDEKLQKCQRVV